MIRTRKFGNHPDGTVVEAILASGDTTVAILNFGCVIRDWRVPVGAQRLPVVLGFDDFQGYLADTKSVGIIAGRVANRIASGRFRLGDKEIRLPVDPETGHTLHGGPTGLGRQLWQLDTDSARNAIRLRYFSPHGEGGFPGNVRFEIEFCLDGATLTCVMKAMPDRPTPINLAQHSYYNLNGGGDVRNHVVQVAASRFTPLDAELIPTGEISPVNERVFDFRRPTSIAENDASGIGIDTNMILDHDRDESEPAAGVSSPDTGVRLQLWTGEPAIQLFNAPKMTIPMAGLGGRQYGPFAGLCLEPQHFPNSVNVPEFPSAIRTPESPYYQKLEVRIST